MLITTLPIEMHWHYWRAWSKPVRGSDRQMCCTQRCMKGIPPLQDFENVAISSDPTVRSPARRIIESIYFMRLDLLLSIFLFALLGCVLVAAGHNGYWGLLHLLLCMGAAITILYVSRTRGEYLWLGALGGIALILTILNPTLAVTGSLWPDVICVAAFVGYYKLLIARGQTPGSSEGHGSGHRSR